MYVMAMWRVDGARAKDEDTSERLLQIKVLNYILMEKTNEQDRFTDVTRKGRDLSCVTCLKAYVLFNNPVETISR